MLKLLEYVLIICVFGSWFWVPHVMQISGWEVAPLGGVINGLTIEFGDPTQHILYFISDTLFYLSLGFLLLLVLHYRHKYKENSEVHFIFILRNLKELFASTRTRLLSIAICIGLIISINYNNLLSGFYRLEIGDDGITKLTYRFPIHIKRLNVKEIEYFDYDFPTGRHHDPNIRLLLVTLDGKTLKSAGGIGLRNKFDILEKHIEKRLHNGLLN